MADKKEDSPLEKKILGYTIDEAKAILRSIKKGKPKQCIEPYNVGGSKVRFGVMSDAHRGNKAYDRRLFMTAAKTFNRRNVDFVLDCGDMCDGLYTHRPGHFFELDESSADGQVKMALEDFAEIKAPIFFITGNHTWNTFYKNCGYDIGHRIEESLEGMHYLGNGEGGIELDKGATIMLKHPDGGTAYAISYKSQKIAESLEGGEKPNMMFIGHFHKTEYIFYRNMHIFQAGCFTARVGITTNKGTKPICKIKVGDKVLTHKNRFRKVTKLFKRPFKEDFITINFGRKKSDRSRLRATSEHPVLIERDGIREWTEIKNIKVKDYIFVKSYQCKKCNHLIPYYNSFCNDCNPMHLKQNQLKLSKTKIKTISKNLGKSFGEKHLDKDILPFCKNMKNKGWDIVPVGAGVIPDAVGLKDGKIVLFELENSQGLKLERKKSKYNKKPILDFVDEVRWINLKEKKKQKHNKYVVDKSGFIKLPVLGVKKENFKSKTAAYCSVYNFEVEEDNSYLASNVVVHNCLESQTPFMKGKHISAHKGFWVVTATVGKEGGINHIIPEFYPGYQTK